MNAVKGEAARRARELLEEAQRALVALEGDPAARYALTQVGHGHGATALDRAGELTALLADAARRLGER